MSEEQAVLDGEFVVRYLDILKLHAVLRGRFWMPTIRGLRNSGDPAEGMGVAKYDDIAVSCWFDPHLDERPDGLGSDVHYDDASLWMIYAKYGVAIVAQAGHVKSALNAEPHRVVYRSVTSLPGYLQKQPAFRSEREIRFVRHGLPPGKNGHTVDGARPEHLIHQVVLSPYLQDWQQNELTELVKVAGVPVRRSNLLSPRP